MRFNERLRLAFCAILISAMIIFSFACGGESGNGGSGGNGGVASTYSISGQITTSGIGLIGVTMTLSGTSTGTTTTASNGNYSFTNLSNGSYAVTPSLTDCLFDPFYRNVTISGVSATAVDFVAAVGAAKNIGLAGGTVIVANPISPLYGIKVEVPPDALDTVSIISIEMTTSTPSYNTGSRASSVIFKLESPNASYFNIPVTVTVPYDESLVDDERYIGLFIYNPSTDSWQSTTTYEIDTINNTINAETMHFSIFQVISMILYSIGVDVDTGFRPAPNGFGIPNTGDWCFGMSAYSKWFFQNKKPETLYGFYEYDVAHLVAEEAHSKINAFGGGLLGFAIDLNKALALDSLSFYNLYTALFFTRTPQVLGMIGFSPLVGHAVVAYAIQDGKVYIYDNRYPGVELSLTPDSFGSFSNYGNFTSFIHLNYSVAYTGFGDIYDKYFPDASNFLGIEWIQVPAGYFMMGDNFDEGHLDELPEHLVYLDTYRISKYEVTFDQYDAFCDATDRIKPLDYGWGRGDRPVIKITSYEAKEFCDWLSAQTGEYIHLPTEAQWEKAARGTDQRRYPWGDDPLDSSFANYDNNEGKTMPVGSYPAGVSPYGVHDMAGNVKEFCSDLYDNDYYSYSPTYNPQGPPIGDWGYYVRRGGDWLSYADGIRSANRLPFNPLHEDYSIGFRVCKD